MEEENIRIRFLGAAGTVTGSKHLLITPEMQIMVDCGLFQGLKQLRQKNWEPLNTDVSKISYIIITHAHLDHVGYLPAIIKQGFTGRVLMTSPTRDLAEIILRDSARIQEEDAEMANKRHYTKHKPALPLYTVEDVEKALGFFEYRNDNEWITLSENIRFRFQKNGHILGSAFIEFDCYGKRIVFSGDLGNKHSTILNLPLIPEKADYLIMESTYGDRLHDSESASDALAQIIIKTISKSGVVLIPSFAVGRAQELMFIINQLKEQDFIPPKLPVYLDSPMGIDCTEIMMHYPKWHKLNAEQIEALGKEIHFVHNFRESIRIVKDKSPKIVIAASGMLTGGRILHYLELHLGRKNDVIVLAGYQAEGTRGRSLQDRVKELKLHGHYFPVNCKVKEISSLSAHADQKELLDWVKGIPVPPKRIFLVHGEPKAQDVLRLKIQDELSLPVTIPSQNDEIALN